MKPHPAPLALALGSWPQGLRASAGLLVLGLYCQRNAYITLHFALFVSRRVRVREGRDIHHDMIMIVDPRSDPEDLLIAPDDP